MADAREQTALAGGETAVSPVSSAAVPATDATQSGSTDRSASAAKKPAAAKKSPAVKKPAAAKKSPAVKKSAAPTAARTSTAAKTAASKAAASKAAASKAAADRAAADKAAAGKAAAGKAAERTAAVKKASASSAAAKTAAAKKAADAEAGKTAAVRKAAAQKAAGSASTEADAAGADLPAAGATEHMSAAKTSTAKKAPGKTSTGKAAAAKTTPKTPRTSATGSKTTGAKTTGAKSTTKTTGKGTGEKPTTGKATAAKTTTAKTKATTAKSAVSEPVLTAQPSDGAAVAQGGVDDPITLDSAAIRPLVAASNSAEAAEARPPRNRPAGSAVIVDDDSGRPHSDSPLEPVAADAPAAAGAAAAVEVSGDAPTDTVAGEAIRIRGLVKRFGDVNAVDGVDLTVPAGSFYGLVGPNGAGKTTTLSIIAGLLRPDAGTVHISGIDQHTKPLEAKRMMGVLPDRLRTFDRLTGRQLLYYYGQLRGLDRAVIEKRTADLARAFDLSEALSRVVSDYSAGMTKKVMLAGALIHSPRVLVLDEPFESVDPVSSGVILDILRSYVSHGGTVILSSHGMDLVERVCSRVAVIVGGELLAEGTIDEVRAGQTLTERFIELSGGAGEVEGLEWLHTFSD